MLLIDAAQHRGAGERENFASDGFHASPEGHRRLGAGVVSALHEQLGIEIRLLEEAMA
jgi:lysophospholipase L1-like esterase